MRDEAFEGGSFSEFFVKMERVGIAGDDSVRIDVLLCHSALPFCNMPQLRRIR